jgi:DNA-binding MarR family transcriptional regulator
MTQKAALPGPRYETLIRLLFTADTIWNLSRTFFARWKLSPSQFNVINLLHDLPAGLSQTALGRQLLMHRSNLTGLVDNLVRRGLVERRAVPDDRRAYRVVLTASGTKLIGEILPHYYRGAELALGGLTPEQATRLARELDEICARAGRTTLEIPVAAGRPRSR